MEGVSEPIQCNVSTFFIFSLSGFLEFCFHMTWTNKSDMSGKPWSNLHHEGDQENISWLWLKSYTLGNMHTPRLIDKLAIVYIQ